MRSTWRGSESGCQRARASLAGRRVRVCESGRVYLCTHIVPGRVWGDESRCDHSLPPNWTRLSLRPRAVGSALRGTLGSGMASTSGLSRRRGAAAQGQGGALNPSHTQPALSPNHSRPTSPLSAPGQPSSSSPGGHKVAYDERDLNNSEDDRVNPRLTLMEEVLLLGLKDKQASPDTSSVSGRQTRVQGPGTRSRRCGALGFGRQWGGALERALAAGVLSPEDDRDPLKCGVALPATVR